MHRFLITLILTSMVVGCSLWPESYKVPIQQGNPVSAEAMQQLHPGMQKSEVLYHLGPPLLNNTEASRWDYVSYEIQKGQTQDYQRLSLFFRGDELIRIVADGNQ